jgi:hypothetical protein
MYMMRVALALLCLVKVMPAALQLSGGLDES